MFTCAIAITSWKVRICIAVTSSMTAVCPIRSITVNAASMMTVHNVRVHQSFHFDADEWSNCGVLGRLGYFTCKFVYYMIVRMNVTGVCTRAIFSSDVLRELRRDIN